MRILLAFLFCISTLFSKGKPTEIVLWHAFDGFLCEVFEEIISDFNHHSGAYLVVLKKAGNYQEVVEKGLEAFPKKAHPHILQIYEVATLSAMEKRDTFLPVDQLMLTYHKKFDPDIYIDAVRSYYTSPEGQMMSLPWNASTGILFYNKNAFREAGLNPEQPPKTWEELEKYCQQLRKAGYIGFTTAWPAAYHLEHLCCWHNLPFASKGNGLDGTGAKLIFNGPNQVHHIRKVAEWQKKGFFQYAGRYSEEPENLFASEKCAMLFQGANRLPLIQRNADFPIGVGYMPYWSQITKVPFNLNIGGSSFWVMRGFSKHEYRGVMQFFEYLSSTEIQAFWHQKTGYLPITEAAYYLTKKKGFYKDHLAAEIAVLEVMSRAPTPNTRGVRLPNYMEVRNVIIDHLEKAFSGELSPQEALDQAVAEGNKLL
ncbi:MAG: sn-glycerol-3-phosphate-binding periplasmic protein UgpB [Chlamydiae bacterium]|nr:sn-glycerol-3-phosphate-binding periplasmic protein UgpB [Chlamydiota bacterium]